MVPSVPGNDKILISSPPLIGVYTGTFILTGYLSTGEFNRSTVVAVQDAVRVLPKVVFFLHYNTTLSHFLYLVGACVSEF